MSTIKTHINSISTIQRLSLENSGGYLLSESALIQALHKIELLTTQELALKPEHVDEILDQYSDGEGHLIKSRDIFNIYTPKPSRENNIIQYVLFGIVIALIVLDIII